MSARLGKGGVVYKEEIACATCPDTEKKWRKETERSSLWQSRGTLGRGTRFCKASEELVKVWNFILRIIIII